MYMYVYIHIYIYIYYSYTMYTDDDIRSISTRARLLQTWPPFPRNSRDLFQATEEDQVQERTVAKLKGLNNSWMRRMQRMRRKKTMHLFWQPHQILRENLQIVAAHKQTAKNRKEDDGKKTKRIRKK